MGILTVDQSQEINVWKSIVLLGQVDLVEGRGCHLGRKGVRDVREYVAWS